MRARHIGAFFFRAAMTGGKVGCGRRGQPGRRGLGGLGARPRRCSGCHWWRLGWSGAWRRPRSQAAHPIVAVVGGMTRSRPSAAVFPVELTDVTLVLVGTVMPGTAASTRRPVLRFGASRLLGHPVAARSAGGQPLSVRGNRSPRRGFGIGYWWRGRRSTMRLVVQVRLNRRSLLGRPDPLGGVFGARRRGRRGLQKRSPTRLHVTLVQRRHAYLRHIDDRFLGAVEIFVSTGHGNPVTGQPVGGWTLAVLEPIGDSAGGARLPVHRLQRRALF